jgi:hypothetical protein
LKIELVGSFPIKNDFQFQLKENAVYECNFDNNDNCNAIYTVSTGSTTKYDFRLKSFETVTGENYVITDYSSVCK